MREIGNSWYELTNGKKVQGKSQAEVAQQVLDYSVRDCACEVSDFPKRTKDKVCIIGFAPDTRELAPLDDDSMDFWGLNELYLDMPKLAQIASGWFQLHGYEPPKIRDPEQIKHLGQLKCPVFMWGKHKDIPNSVKYPHSEILDMFDIYGEGMAPDIPNQRDRVYFTNSVSWMIVLAIYMGYKEIHMYGVNMAQVQEFEHQRPSCEFFLGWARGQGVKVYLPIQSDLCQAWVQYGYDDGSKFMEKMYARDVELDQRIEAMERERIGATNHAQDMLMQIHQLRGAKENSKYMQNLGPRGYHEDVQSNQENDQSAER